MRTLSNRLILATACLLLPAGLFWLCGFFRARPAGPVEAVAAGLPTPWGTPLPEGVANAQVPGDANWAPVWADFSWQAEGLTVSFTNESQGEVQVSYRWAFGDGSNSTEESPTHTYALPGTYAVSLLVFGVWESDVVIRSVRVGYSDGVFLPTVLYSLGGPAPPSPPACGITLSAGPTFDGSEVKFRITNGGTTTPDLLVVNVRWGPGGDALRELYWGGTSVWSGIGYNRAVLPDLSGELPAGATSGLRFRFESGPISWLSFRAVFDDGCSVSYWDPGEPPPPPGVSSPTTGHIPTPDPCAIPLTPLPVLDDG